MSFPARKSKTVIKQDIYMASIDNIRNTMLDIMTKESRQS